jgi:demethylmenaquinone methyltransferase/2-methoxy-6-polyprenyl-1,4-benzoquinol methylase
VILTLFAYFLGLGLSAHALNELHARHWGDALSKRELRIAFAAPLFGALLVGGYGMYVLYRVAQSVTFAPLFLLAFIVIEVPTSFVENARFVKVIFTDVEREYDMLLHLMTLGMDWTWRRRLLARVEFSQARRMLDLACGTGLVTFDLSNSAKGRSMVVGLDPSKSMLRAVIRKKRAMGSENLPEFVRATGEFLPFRNQTFEYVTVGLALRNFGDRSAVFSESNRVLVPQGWFLSVDFVLPETALLRRLYLFHIFHVLPALGRLVSASWHRILAYLANSIKVSAPPEQIRRVLLACNFRQAFSEKITLGVVALVGGEK